MRENERGENDRGNDKQEWEGQGIFETDCFRPNPEIRRKRN